MDMSMSMVDKRWGGMGGHRQARWELEEGEEEGKEVRERGREEGGWKRRRRAVITVGVHGVSRLNGDGMENLVNCVAEAGQDTETAIRSNLRMWCQYSCDPRRNRKSVGVAFQLL